MITKLVQWLLGGGLFMGIWSALVFDLIQLNLSEAGQYVVLALPIYLLIAFACYSLAVVGYRVATFNDCPQAAEELQRQMAEAKADLNKMGMKFS